NIIVTAFKRGGKHCKKQGGTGIGSMGLDDAILTKVTTSGKIDWIKVMPIKLHIKGAWSVGAVSNYINCFYKNNNLYYIFNDNKDNEKIDLTKVETSDITK